MYLRNLRNDIRAVKEGIPPPGTALKSSCATPAFMPSGGIAGLMLYTAWGPVSASVHRRPKPLLHRRGHSSRREDRERAVHRPRLRVVIGETAVIGNNVTIYQGATLGGTGKDTGKRHPTIEDDVVVAAGAKILGPFTVGRGSKIGAGAVVLEEVPPTAPWWACPGASSAAAPVLTAGPSAPVPNAIWRNANIKPNLDQVHLPDPVRGEMAELRSRIEALEGIIQQMTKEEDSHETL